MIPWVDILGFVIFKFQTHLGETILDPFIYQRYDLDSSVH